MINACVRAVSRRKCSGNTPYQAPKTIAIVQGFFLVWHECVMLFAIVAVILPWNPRSIQLCAIILIAIDIYVSTPHTIMFQLPIKLKHALPYYINGASQECMMTSFFQG